MPKVAQAVLFAAVGDYYTWKLGEKVYGTGSNEAWAAVCNIGSTQLKHLIINQRSLADFDFIGLCSSP